MAQIKILSIVPTAYSLGGVATWLDYWLAGLRGMGSDLTLGVISAERFHLATKYLNEHPDSKVCLIPVKSGLSLERIGAGTKAIRRTRANMIVSVNAPDSLLSANEEKRRRQIYSVMTCHGIQDDLFQDMALLSPSLDAVVCTNRLACELAREIGGIDESRIFHAPYGTDVPSSLAKPVNDKRLVIAYCGRLEQPQKRIHDLVAIVRCLKRDGIPFLLRLAGTGPEEFRLRTSLQTEGLIEHVDFLGHVTANRVRQQLYHHANALIVPSLWETGPIVIWEAMAAGLPVVSSRYVGSGKERLLKDNENCLLFNVGDTFAAANQLKRLYAEQGLADRLRETAFSFALAHLSHKASVDRWHRVLQSIVSVPPLPFSSKVRSAIPRTGRLDSLLGWRLASRLRKSLGRSRTPRNAAEEWPHTLAGNRMPEQEFWALAKRLDTRPEEL